MEATIDANALLDYIEFQICPSQNRYKAYVSYENKKDNVSSGVLEHLSLHSTTVKDLQSKGSNAKYKLSPPENKNPHNRNWFTKSTLARFLNILDITSSTKKEISQLEEARKFHLSLYSKGMEYQVQSGESDSSYSNGTSTPKAEGRDASKNELLRAMDLRLSALRGELSAAVDQAVGSGNSVEEMMDLEKFSHHFGSIDLRDSLMNHIELLQNQTSDLSSRKEENNHTTPPVKYGVSPAKVAQVERQNSSESDESSFSSDESQPSVERSRSLIRSASPRRSASPMRRIQIGRSGSRRSTAITIKSMSYIPARDRSFFPKENDSDEEQEPKRIENKGRTMSVQDKINLFESKKKDQAGDVQNPRTLLNGPNKSVLRRWSSGLETQNNQEIRETESNSPENESQPRELSVESNPPEKTDSSPVQDTLPVESSPNLSEKVADSAEWTRQREAELNELLTKMGETKAANNSKKQSLPVEQRGNFYDHYKEKRDEKLRGESGKKKAEKDKQFKAMQQILDSRKSQLNSVSGTDAGKKQNVKKLVKPQKVASQPVNPKPESPKLAKKASPKATSSSLPATRKSWPSIPSPRAQVGPPNKVTPVGTTAPARRRSQPSPPISRPNPKVETPQPRPKPKSLKPKDIDSKKSPRTGTAEKPVMVKPSKTTRGKAQTAPEDSVVSAKPSLYSKVTKRGSVVPLESKPFLRKGTGTNILSVNTVAKTKVPSPTREQLTINEDPVIAEENKSDSNFSDQVVIQRLESESGESKIHTDIEPEMFLKIPLKCEENTFTKSPPKCEENTFTKCPPKCEENTFTESPSRCEEDKNLTEVYPVVEPELKDEFEEESTISPTAWVEIEEHYNPPLEEISQMGPQNRVRHSLSQMLLEETSEPDTIDWGNAENPPPIVYQKDAPKGLKRLLNFARKNKGDANSTGWSSPVVVSEGEDEADDSKFVNKRTHQKNSTDSGHPGQANISKFGAQSLSQQLQEGHISASVTTTRATRSFFSLSAFKGGK